MITAPIRSPLETLPYWEDDVASPPTVLLVRPRTPPPLHLPQILDKKSYARFLAEGLRRRQEALERQA